MSWGIETRNTEGVITFNSSVDRPAFMRESTQIPLGVDVDISSSMAPSNSSYFLFPTGTISVNVPEGSGWVLTPVHLTTLGGVSPDNVAKAPVFTSTLAGRGPDDRIKPTVAQASSSIEVMNSHYNYVSGSSYGIRINGSELYSDFGMYVVVKTHNGDYLRTATAHSLSNAKSDGHYSTSSDSLPMNIAFDSALVDPPLMFITSSDDYVSFAGFVKNEGGLYIGAKVLCQPAKSYTSGSTLTDCYRDYRTVPFTYYYAANATEFDESGTFGISIKTSEGSLAFSVPKYTPVKVVATGFLGKPHLRMNYIENSNDHLYFQELNSWSFPRIQTGFPSPLSICINNINAFEGAYWYTNLIKDHINYGVRGVSGTGVQVSSDTISIKGLRIIEGWGHTATAWAASWHTNLSINPDTKYLFSHGVY